MVLLLCNRNTDSTMCSVVHCICIPFCERFLPLNRSLSLSLSPFALSLSIALNECEPMACYIFHRPDQLSSTHFCASSPSTAVISQFSSNYVHFDHFRGFLRHFKIGKTEWIMEPPPTTSI